MSDFALPPTDADRTAELAIRAFEARVGRRTPSRRLGGSSVGKPCRRASWLSFRWASPVVVSANGLLAIEDGFRGEDFVAKLLREAPGVELWTEDPEVTGRQISFELLDGHFVGKLDGVIIGLQSAPKTPHVWECKVVNEKKFKALQALIDKHGEKNALEKWDEVYFAQAQIYMHGMRLDRHYLTVASPGVRALIGVRTEKDGNTVQRLLSAAEDIVFSTRAPAKISEDPANFQCKWCDHWGLCHSERLPEVNCRTCIFNEPQRDGTWRCTFYNQETTYAVQVLGCKKHRYNPHIVGMSRLHDSTPDGCFDAAYKIGGALITDTDKPEKPANPWLHDPAQTVSK